MRHWDFESQNLGSTSDSRSRNPAGATKFQVAIATAGPKKASPQFCLCKQAAFATIGLALADSAAYKLYSANFCLFGTNFL